GAYAWSPYKGYDFYRMSQSSTYLSPYGVAHGLDYKLQAHQITAFTPRTLNSHALSRGGIVGWYNTFPFQEPYAEYAVWAGALQRQNAMLYFEADPGGSTMTAFSPDVRPLTFFARSMEVA